jgi:serine/threonine protein phosphatase 1
MSRTIVVGDVHGCLYELHDLIQTAGGLQPEDRWIFVGDLIHKGPFSQGVVDLVKGMPNATVVQGNHEEKHVRWHLRELQQTAFGRANNMLHCEEYPGLLTEDSIEFLRDTYLFADTGSFTVVHGGIPSGIQWLPTRQDFNSGSRKSQKHFQQILRTRYVNPNGKMVALGHETEEDVYWADVYDGRFGFVIFGHQPFEEPAFFDHAIGIDTGCVHGNKLTAVVIENDEITDIISVPARSAYQEQLMLASRRPATTFQEE